MPHPVRPRDREVRKNDRTPFEVFEFLYGEGTAAKLHIAKIDPKEVVLKPRHVGIELK